MKIWYNWKPYKPFITSINKYWFEKYNIDADYEIIEATDKVPEIIKKIKQEKVIRV